MRGRPLKLSMAPYPKKPKAGCAGPRRIRPPEGSEAVSGRRGGCPHRGSGSFRGRVFFFLLFVFKAILPFLSIFLHTHRFPFYLSITSFPNTINTLEGTSSPICWKDWKDIFHHTRSISSSQRTVNGMMKELTHCKGCLQKRITLILK